MIFDFVADGLLRCRRTGGDYLNIRFWQILLQKSVAPDGCSSVIRLRATGFNPPALTPSTQL
jgi:hypothetical protein